MQFLSSLTRNADLARREQPAGAHLPYARHVDDATLELRDGLLMLIAFALSLGALGMTIALFATGSGT